MNGLLLILAASAAPAAAPAPVATPVRAIGIATARVVSGVRVMRSGPVPAGARRKRGLVEFE